MFSVHQMATGSHFGCPKIALDLISRHFRSMRNFYILKCYPKIAFFAISVQYVILTFGIFFHKLLDAWRSLESALLAISDKYATFGEFLDILFAKWSLSVAVGHFGWLKHTFKRISRHFRSIRYFYCIFLSQNGRQRAT